MDASVGRVNAGGDHGTVPLHPVAESVEGVAAEALPSVVGTCWQVLSRLGGGTFGTVYRASHVVLPEHEVALKLLEAPCTTPEGRERALHEVRLLASVSSPYVVQVKEWGWHQDRLYFTMPLYRGCTLAEESARRDDLAMAARRRAARRMFVPLAHGLAALHRAGLVHQDVKPENVYLAVVEGSTERFPILLDLGVARRVDRALLAGTPRYCAPEMARRFLGEDTPVGPPADVFGLALTLLEWLCPEALPPTEGVSANELLLRRVGSGPGLWRMDVVPRDLRPWFTRWLSTDPSQRPDATRFAQELAVLTRPEEVRARAQWAATRVGVPAAMVVMALVACVVNLNLRARTVLAEEHLEHMNRVAEQQDHARDHEELSAVNGLLHARLDQVSRVRDAVVAERDRVRVQRDEARTERTVLRNERDALQTERDRVQAERDALQADRDRVVAERDAVTVDRDRVQAERDRVGVERDQLRGQRDAVVAERDQVRGERDRAVAERQRLLAEDEALRAERERLQSERAMLVAERDQMRQQRDEARTEASRRVAVTAVPGQVPMNGVYPVPYQGPAQPRL